MVCSGSSSWVLGVTALIVGRKWEKRVKPFTSITSKSVCIAGGAPDCLDHHPDAACSHPTSCDFERCKTNCKKWEKVWSNWVHNLVTDVGEANTLDGAETKDRCRENPLFKGKWQDISESTGLESFYRSLVRSSLGIISKYRENLSNVLTPELFLYQLGIQTKRFESPAFRFWRACFYSSMSEFVKNT